jgi:glycolate oxidase
MKPPARSKAASPALDPQQLSDATRVGAKHALAKSFVTMQELVMAAHRTLSRPHWDQLCGGSDSETTLRRNRLGIDSLALEQRVLVDVSAIDTSTSVLGTTIPIPVFIAPVGNFLQVADPDGVVPVARAAVAKGVPMFVSTAAKPGIEAAAAAVSQPMIFQLYVRSDRAWVADILDRAKAAGYSALCVTVDRAFYSRRERDLVSRLSVRELAVDQSHQARLTWDDVVWMKQHIGLPLILKGIATPADARLAVEHGADVVYVSNHGGRQLDHGRASIDVLPRVVAAVDGRAEVLVDGGFCRGTDVVKAIALGARAVGLGKLQGWALAAAGEAGVTRMLEIMEAEIRTTLGLMGIRSLSELDPSWVVPVPPLSDGSLTSAFPIFEEQRRR